MPGEDEAIPQLVPGAHPQPPAQVAAVQLKIATILAEGPGTLVCTNRGSIHHSGYHCLPHQVRLHIVASLSLEFATEVRDLLLRPLRKTLTTN